MSDIDDILTATGRSVSALADLAEQNRKERAAYIRRTMIDAAVIAVASTSAIVLSALSVSSEVNLYALAVASAVAATFALVDYAYASYRVHRCVLYANRLREALAYLRASLSRNLAKEMRPRHDD